KPIPVATLLAPVPSRSTRPLIRVSLVLRSTVATRTAFLPIPVGATTAAGQRAGICAGLSRPSFNTNRPPVPLSRGVVKARFRLRAAKLTPRAIGHRRDDQPDRRDRQVGYPVARSASQHGERRQDDADADGEAHELDRLFRPIGRVVRRVAAE